MSYIRNFTSVSINTTENVVQINDNVSNFAIKTNSQLFIEGYSLPVTVESSNTQDRTLTLTAPWPNANVVEKPAKIIPLGDADVYLSAVEANRAAYNALIEAINNPAGDLQPAVEAALEYLYTQVAQSPPVRQSQSLTHILSDYPTLKKTVDVPTHSPNNKREMLFDDVRKVAYVALTDEWLPIPNIIATREFLLTTANNRVYFNNAYTGNLTLRVYPMGSGGSGLPNSPSLTDFEWHTVTTTVSNLGQFGSGFVGLIDFIQTDDGFETLSTARSHFNSIDAYYGNSNGDATINQFKPFSLRQDGYWYSSDVMPETPNSLGNSWSQDADDKKLFTVTNADGGSDALRPFNDSWDGYEFEIVIVTNIANPMALTISNSEEYSTFFAGTYRFITKDDRLYFKRRAGHAPITGSVRIESIRLRVAHYE